MIFIYLQKKRQKQNKTASDGIETKEKQREGKKKLQSNH